MEKTPPHPFSTAFLSAIQTEPPVLLSREEAFLADVCHSIFKNISSKTFNTSTLARAVNLSVSQLNRKLRALTGLSAGRLIREIRLQEAARLLIQNADTIGNIAYQTGFYDQAHFCRSFKQYFKCTPSRFLNHQVMAPVLTLLL